MHAKPPNPIPAVSSLCSVLLRCSFSLAYLTDISTYRYTTLQGAVNVGPVFSGTLQVHERLVFPMRRTSVTRKRDPLPSRGKYSGVLRLPSASSSIRQELHRSQAERHADDTLQTFEPLRPSCMQRILTMFQVSFLAHLSLARSSRCVTQWFSAFCALIGPGTSTHLNSPVCTAAKDIRCVHADNYHPDPSNPDLIRIKVGRSVDVRSRLRQHRKRCPSSKPKLLGQFPSKAPPQTPRVRFYDRLERLVHIELAELSANSHPPARSAVNLPCVDC